MRQKRTEEFRLNEQRVSLADARFEQLEIGSTRSVHREMQNRGSAGVKKNYHQREIADKKYIR